MSSLSVIIPIYNVEEYLGDCLDSLIKSMKLTKHKNEINVILVNDGTKDNSGEIAKKYSSNHNFRYVEKTNGGLGDARNFGLKYVASEYVAFIDSDDKISEDFFPKIFRALEDKPDLVIFDWYDYLEEEDKLDKVVKGIENPDYLWTVQPSAWNKVYKRNLFEEIKFPKGKVYEDVGTIYKLLSKVEVYNYVDSPLYIYRKGRQNSLLTTISPKINDIYDVLEDTYFYYCNTIDENIKIKEGLGYQYIKLLMWSNMYRQLKFYKFKYLFFYKKMKYTRSLIYEKFPDWNESKFLHENSNFLRERFGENYLTSIDNMGKNLFSTTFTLGRLIFRNMGRK
ncbi:family 2 glycosyl transferase [Priestia megaterium]|uniref:glycosyltransferase family 2 protein n=1 Tax=Priestia megaterium TaxID=1404 RepID=UPI000BFE0770|nr:glycosyltransferase family 2 protein [Priestia megaterium]PGT51021.1 family 2 glycosyl transferase [Priestia megaterium]